LKIEAVTVCVDYADFLKITLPSLRAAVDDLVVVTAPRDLRTQQLCRREDVHCLVTTAMYEAGGPFSLGAALNAGLRSIPLEHWALVVDADIVLPSRMHRTLDHLRLDKSKLYGIDRVHCRGWSAWHRYCTEPREVRTFEIPSLRDFDMGARIQLPAADTMAGYVPCGYFQLWNAAATGYRDYPIASGGTAAGSDLLHSLRFPRQYRELIPELVAVQIETDRPSDPVGVNWGGRRTPEFSAEGGPYRR
jgi:hypothetical protein